jgi:hypothetical protein
MWKELSLIRGWQAGKLQVTRIQRTSPSHSCLMSRMMSKEVDPRLHQSSLARLIKICSLADTKVLIRVGGKLSDPVLAYADQFRFLYLDAC